MLSNMVVQKNFHSIDAPMASGDLRCCSSEFSAGRHISKLVVRKMGSTDAAENEDMVPRMLYTRERSSWNKGRCRADVEYG
jgi:hypothetical protein